MQPVSEERHDPPSEQDGIGQNIRGNCVKAEGLEEAEGEEALRNRLDASRSYATDASAMTGPPSAVQPAIAKPWCRRINPLRWGAIPPVPKERIVSREYKAGFFSKLTFQWMSPLMAVSGYNSCQPLHSRRHWKCVSLTDPGRLLRC